MQNQIIDQFISSKPNVPKIAEFKKETPLFAPVEKITQNPNQIGPIKPSDDEDYESDEEAFEPEYDRTHKFNKLSETQSAKVYVEETQDDDYIDPVALARDPALKEAVAQLAKKKTLLSFAPQNEDIPDFDIQGDRIKSLPISHELIIKGHTKQATAIGIDNAGSRLVTGAYDCVVRFWDFHGMDKNMHSFRMVTPYEGNPITTIGWAKDGKNVLICCADA